MTTRKLGNILLVDDEESVLSAFHHTLLHYGYQVFVAADGPTALALFETHREVIDLLITDLDMPGMSGAMLAQLLLQRRPNLPVLFMSGGVDADPALTQSAFPRYGFLAKPFPLTEFFIQVEALLS